MSERGYISVKALTLTRTEQKKIGAIVVGVTLVIPIYAILFSLIGLIDQPVTLSFLRFSIVSAFVFSLPLVAFFIAIKDKTP